MQSTSEKYELLEHYSFARNTLCFKYLGFSLFILIAFSPIAIANPITICGDSQGTAFYFGGGAVPPASSGWQQDKATGSTMFLVKEFGEYNLIIAEKGNRVVDHKKAGAILAGFSGELNRLLILVVYPLHALVEHYIFDLDSAGNGQVLWGSARAGTAIGKSSLMRSLCRAPS